MCLSNIFDKKAGGVRSENVIFWGNWDDFADDSMLEVEDFWDCFNDKTRFGHVFVVQGWLQVFVDDFGVPLKALCL